MSETETTEAKARKPKTPFDAEVSIAKRCKAALDTLPHNGKLAVLAMIERHVRENAPAAEFPA
jgi:hypothetical protein